MAKFNPFEKELEAEESEVAADEKSDLLAKLKQLAMNQAAPGTVSDSPEVMQAMASAQAVPEEAEISTGILPSQVAGVPGAEVVPQDVLRKQTELALDARMNPGEEEEDPYMSNARLSAMGQQMPVGEQEVSDEEIKQLASKAKAPSSPKEGGEGKAPASAFASLAELSGGSSSIDDAQAERRDALASAERSRLAETIRAGLSSAPGTIEYSPDFSEADRVAKLGGLGMQEVKEDLDLKPAEAMADANSEISNEYRAMAKELLGRDVPEGLSAAQLAKTLPMLQQIASAKKSKEVSPWQQFMMKNRSESLDLRTKKEERLKEKFGYSKTEKYEDDAARTLKDLRGRKPFQDAEKIVMEIGKLRPLIEDAKANGGQSLSMLGPKIAKGLAGEVGVLTEQDVTRYVNNPQVAQGIYDRFLKGTKGKLSDISAENLLRLAEVMEKASKANLESLIDEEATLFSRRENIPYDDARYFIDAKFEKAGSAPKEAKASAGSEPITVRRKSDGAEKTLPPEKAAKYLNDPKFERVK